MKHNATAIKTLARNGWRPTHALRLVLAFAAALLVTWPAWRDMAGAAIRHDYARPIVLVIPVMIWLVWVRRARFRFVRPGGSGMGWVVLVAGLQIYLMADLIFGLRSATHLGAVLTVMGAVMICVGRSAVIQFLPAWLLAPLLVPVPHTVAALIATPIQHLEASAVAMIYSLFDVRVEVIRSSSTLSQLIVGDEKHRLSNICKSLPNAISLMLISYGFVFGSPMRPSVRVALLVISPVVALLCSAVALCGTLWLYDGRWALVTEDLIRALSEWATLLLAFLLIAGALRVLIWASVPVHQYHLASASP